MGYIFRMIVLEHIPAGIDYGIATYFKDQGADQVNIDDVSFNPFSGRLTLTNFTVSTEAQTVLKIAEATFRIQWIPFVRKRFVLQQFTISDTQITVEELESGKWRIGGITLPETKKTRAPSSWNFSFQEALVINSKVKLISDRLKSDLVIEQAKLFKLTSWLHDNNARLEFSGKLNDAPLQLQLDISPFGDEMALAGQIKLAGLSLKPFAQLLQPHLKTLEGHVDVDLKVETRKKNDSGFNHHQKGLVKLHQIRTQTADVKLSKEDLAWDGAIRVDIPQSQEALKIITDGQLNGSRLTLEMENESLKVQQNNISWKGKIDYAQDKTGQKINTNGRVGLVGLIMESPKLNLSEEKLTWKGVLQFISKAETESQRIITDGALDGSQFQASLKDRKLTFKHQGLSWTGRLDSGEANDFSAIQTKADVTLKEIEILHSDTNQHLLDSQEAELRVIQIEGLDKINVSNMVLNELALLSGSKSATAPVAEPSSVRIQKVSFKDIHLLQQQNLAIDAIQLQAAKAYVHRSPQGKFPTIDRWNIIAADVFLADPKNQVASDIKATDTSSKFGFRIRQIDISEGSELQFKDESVRPAFNLDLNVQEARIAELDSNQPQQPASVKLLISDKEHARLSVDGTLQPFAEKLSLDGVAKIEALELPPFSPYVIQNTGYRFLSGELQADIPVKVDQNQLDGELNLILFNPTVKRVKTDALPEENQGKLGITMPLDSALKLLRDEQSNVKLNIPISGDINDPEFSIADAVNKVLVKTLQTSTLSYLKFALGPYGIGLVVAKKAISGIARIHLNPISFAAGSDELDDAAIDYSRRIAAILKEHPEVQVSVCGVATDSDRTAMRGGPSAPGGGPSTAQTDSADSALLALAERRSDQIQNQLVQSHGIAAERIISCKPQFDKDTDGQPRVDLDI